MAASIVNALMRELHDFRQQVDTLEESVVVLESSTTTNACITTLETEHQAFHCHLVEVQLQLDNGENKSRRNSLRLRGILEDPIGPDLRATVVAILNKVLGRVHHVTGPRAPSLSSQGPATLDMP